MKKVFLLVLLLALTNCAQETYFDWYKIKSIGEKFETVEEVHKWVWENIDYTNKKDVFQLPQETLDSRKGDCEDYTLLFIAMVYKYLDYKCHYVEISLDGKQLDHAVAKYKGRYYDCTNLLTYKVSAYKKKIEYPFEEIQTQIALGR